ncbi:MAG TPA: glycosyltransferase family 39 protein [Anaerolineales bacterium]|nr:glycosyltransferase family 39 protein [Anaerolineales bacterium]
MFNQDARLQGRIERGFRALVIVPLAALAAADLFIIFSRLFYPYQLEWMEGAGLVQVSRLLAGGALYVPPSTDFVPLIYPPLYFYLSAGLAKITGLGFGALRLVSFLSSAACGAIIFLAVQEQTDNKFAALVGAGSFAAAFLLTGQWFDIARTDMFAAALSMLGIYLARERKDDHPAAALLGGIVFALAFLTKQSALIIGLAAIFYFFIFNWRRGLQLALSFGLAVTLIYGIFWLDSAGWISYYLFALPAAHAFDFSIGRVLSVLIGQFAPIPVLLLAGIAPLIISPRKISGRRLYRYWIVMAGALIATGIVGRLNAFSGPNVYVPSYLGVALLVGLAAGWVIELKIRPALMILAWVLLSAQFCLLIPAYLQTKTIPSPQDRAAGNALVAKIKSYGGDVLLLDNNYLALYAGKVPYFNEMPMSEISGQGNLHPMPEWTALQPQIDRLIHAPTTAAVLVDFSLPIQRMISGCREQPIAYADKIVFEPVAGPPNSRPSLIITCK